MRHSKLLMTCLVCLAAFGSQAFAIQFFNITAAGVPNDVLDGFAFDIHSPEIFFATPALSNFFANPAVMEISYEAQVEAGEGYLTSLTSLPIGFTFGDAVVQYSAKVFDADTNQLIATLAKDYTGGGFGDIYSAFSHGAGHIRVEQRIAIKSEHGDGLGSMSGLSNVIGTEVPEPASLSVLGAAAALLVTRGRKGAK
jgi:hypothetical protein